MYARCRARALTPQFNKDALPASLAEYQIGYEHLAKLGGLRGRQQPERESPNDFWQNVSFRNYADYAATEAFREGLRALSDLGGERSCAIMCAEAVWWRCHRRIIADYLLAAGERVCHILGPGHVAAAELSASAQREPDGTLVYGAGPSAD